jgi:hypothetical protein
MSAEFAFAEGSVPLRGRVIRRMKDEEGRPIGTHHNNSLFDTRVYQVENV